MSDHVLPKKELKQLFDKLQAGDYQIYAPARQGETVDWTTTEQADDFSWTYINTEQSPKSFLFPQTETLMCFADDGQGMAMQPPAEKADPQALVGVRPCDAKALSILDTVFDRPEGVCDPYWKDKRGKTLLIGLACRYPCPTCFCTAVACGPHHEEGLDVLLIDLGEDFLLRGITSQGEALIADFPPAAAEQLTAATAQKQDAEQAIAVDLDLARIQSQSVMDLYASDFWDQVAEPCLNCGVCTFFCPTCHCFDIQDETKGQSGRRLRIWDTCMSRLFTQHASGHNPRPTSKDRVRQRFMHKFKYMPVKLNLTGCVGCGRCIQKCPVNLDVREVVHLMNQDG